MDEGGGLQGVVGTLVGHVVAGEAAQFGVDHGRKLVEGGLVSAAPRLQQFGDLFQRLRIGSAGHGESGSVYSV